MQILPDGGLYLENIITDKKFREQGYANRLLTNMIHDFRNDYTFIKLDVHPIGNNISVDELERWYESFGFVKIGNTNMKIGNT